MIFLQQDSPAVINSAAPTLVVCLVFVLYALMASGIIFALGRIFFRAIVPTYFRLLFFALAGGTWGVMMHLYVRAYMVAESSNSVSSLGKMFSLFSLFTFVNMLVIPVLAIWIAGKNRKIRELKEELKHVASNPYDKSK
jgi:hypothetical protein